jgi:hypothetical protein
MKDIDWCEYERRKAKVQNIGLSCGEYDATISRIVTDLERDADMAETHEAKTTNSPCSCCGGRLEPLAGYFDPRLTGVNESDPRKYEEAWRCIYCGANFEESDLIAA